MQHSEQTENNSPATAMVRPGTASESDWSLLIKPRNSLWDLQFRETWRYRDLLWMFVKRDFIAVYKQTILGPLWFFIQPLLTTLVFTIIFSGVAKIPTDGMPPVLFYLAGTTPWNYFSACLLKTSNTFVSNVGIFGKVYFPRLVVPLSIVISSVIQFAIQFSLFLSFFAYYLLSGSDIRPQWGLVIVMTPLLVCMMAILGLACGLLASALTTKYRDLTFLLNFGVQLMMYATPIIYSLDSIPTKWRWLVELNPMTALVESFKRIYLGGPLPWSALATSTVVTIILFLAGTIAFNRIERTFMDTV